MNAVVRTARDVSPVRERLVKIEIGTRRIDATVKYRVAYPSTWHRDHGMEPDVEILSATYQDCTEVKQLPMPTRLYDAIVDQIEADELELN